MNVEPTSELELDMERTAKAPFDPVTGSAPLDSELEASGRGSEAHVSMCPKCMTLGHYQGDQHWQNGMRAAYSYICPECGWKWNEPTNTTYNEIHVADEAVRNCSRAGILTYELSYLRPKRHELA